MTQASPRSTQKRPKNPIRIRDAWQALKELIADPDRTDRVFVIIDALSGNSGERQFARFSQTPVGRRVLSERRDILTQLSDRETLRGFPPGSVGRIYAEFMDLEQLTADGLVEASEHAGRGPDEDDDRSRFGMRLRDSHDLWHVVTGYNRDLVGEASLLSFMFAQTRNPGIGVIVAMAYLKAGGDSDARRVIRQAFVRGRRAEWLAGADWEALLSRPIGEVCAGLALGDPPDYTEMRSAAGQIALEAR